MNRSNKIILAALLAAANFTAVAQLTNAVAPADLPKFIATHNIFDPDREPNVPWFRQTPRPNYTAPVVRQADSFSLVGIIGYGEGRLAGVYAFFNGTSLDYQKSAQLGDSIATFKVAGIAADSVTLVSGTNTLVLGIGEQLHNDGIGHWLFANGTAVRYNNNGRAYGRNSGRGGFGGRRRNNNFGNGGNGNFNNNNFGNGNYNAGNFNRFRNNFAPTAGASDNSQMADQGMNSQNDNAAPDDNAAQDNMAPDDSDAQDNNMAAQDDNNDNNVPDAGAQDNTPVTQTDQPPVPSADSTDPNTVLQQLQQQSAAELQQTGH
jgi:hypothetical protein